jgi:hypothetical protein
MASALARSSPSSAEWLSESCASAPSRWSLLDPRVLVREQLAGQHGNSSWVAEHEAAPGLLCRLLNLPAEMLVAIATQLAEGDELTASLACGH